MKNLAIIPARGGSKGVPRKNIKELDGKPLIYYTIKASIKSETVDRTIVSTDDSKIADIAKEYGAEVPFIRPDKLARDNTPTLPVLKHCLNKLKWDEQYTPDTVILLQPTSPLRNSQHIDDATKIFLNEDVDSVVSVFKVKHTPFKMVSLDSQNFTTPFLPKEHTTRRQDLPNLYYINGAIYITTPKTIMVKNTILGKQNKAYKMNYVSSIDIDDETDFKIAEMIIKKNNKSFK